MLARKPSNAVLLNVTPNYVHVARLGRPDSSPLTVEAFAELAPDDDAGLAAWLQREFRDQNRWITGYCGFHPKGRALARDNLMPRKLQDPTYLHSVLTAHIRIGSPRDWRFAALDVATGGPFTPDGAQRAGLIMGLSTAETSAFQQSLIELNIRPRRLEVGTLPALGSVASVHEAADTDQAVAVCEIEPDETRIYIIARNGVHTQPVVPCGLRTIEEAALKELGCADAAAARHRLDQYDVELRRHEQRLMRLFTRHLRLSFDYFEHQTGQVIGAMHCCHLPTSRTWIGQALSKAVDVAPLTFDLPAWSRRVGLGIVTGSPGPGWLATLGLVANLTNLPAATDAPAA